MADPVVTVKYNGKDLIPAPTFSYATSLIYNNDLVIGYNYKITLNGYAIPSGTQAEPNSITNIFSKMLDIKNTFSSNGGALAIKSDNKPLVYATDIKVLSVNFNESNNNWSRFAQYTIELESNHLHLGTDLSADSQISEADILSGKDEPIMADNLHSPYITNIENHKIKSFNENFNVNVDDNIFNQLSVYVDYAPGTGAAMTTFITNNYYNISLTVSAVGKHDIVSAGNSKTTLPAWEHAKRFVHRRLIAQLNRISSNFTNFMKHGNAVTLDQLHNTSIQPKQLISHNGPQFSLYDETLNFTVSESEGSFEATYNALVKQNCNPAPGNPEVNSLACSHSTIHTVNKSVSKTFNANEQTTANNQEITISIDGEIRGLVPGYNVGSDTKSAIKLDTFNNGSFMTVNPTANRIDKNSQAEFLFNKIFDYNGFDLKTKYREALGVTHQVLQIDPATKIKPSKMNLTRNYIDGIITYSAEYNNTYNCPTNHFSVDISVDEPVPIIVEFIVPNNNENEISPSGFPIIQNLGTETAKKINVTINGNIGEDFNKCCLGENNQLNLLDYNFFSLESFSLPSGLIIPVIDDTYVLTSKTKKVTYPQGNFTISLAYTCATTCDIGYAIECQECN